jgi:hypothetical protein
VAAHSKAYVGSRSLVGIAGSNSARGGREGHICLSAVIVVCCYIEFFGMGCSLV